jgi:hypothetical protein
MGGFRGRDRDGGGGVNFPAEYPVVIRVESEYLVWIHADSLDEAVRRTANWPYDLINGADETGGGGVSVDAPDKYDYDGKVYDYCTEYGPWRPGEPHSYGWRWWGPEYTVRIEQEMAEAAAKYAEAGAR